MDLEVAILGAKGGDAAGLMQAMADGGTAGLLSCEGCHSVRVMQGIENPGNVLLLIEWDSVDSHNAARTSAGFAAFKAHAGPFFGDSGSMEHFRIA